jgi:hypothetical protein
MTWHTSPSFLELNVVCLVREIGSANQASRGIECQTNMTLPALFDRNRLGQSALRQVVAQVEIESKT